VIIDTHCHLTHPKLGDEVAVLVDRAREAGLGGCITIGTGVTDGRATRDLTERFPGFVHRTVGIDPFSAHAAGEGFEGELAAMEALLAEGGFVGLGEIGLDYHYDLDPRPVQAERFERQLELAERLDLPVVIHVRDAHEDMAAILGRHPGNRGVIHSFTGGPAEARAYLDLGWLLGFNGVLTFKNADTVREAAHLTPEDRLLVETDSPYLAPVPLRGKRCEPAYVAHTLARLAEVRGEPFDRVRDRTTANARRLFGIEVGTAAT